jgi:hypothetical protein
MGGGRCRHGFSTVVCTGTTKGHREGGGFNALHRGHKGAMSKKGTYVQRAGWDSKF